MTRVDYMRVIDIISELFKADKKVTLKAAGKEIENFEVVTRCEDGTILNYKIHLEKFDIFLLIDKKYFIDFPFEKWISDFEYDLEQMFIKNAHVSFTGEGKDYKIKITI